MGTLRTLLAARTKHVAHLKRKLGISPLNELTSEMAQGIKTVKETPAYVSFYFSILLCMFLHPHTAFCPNYRYQKTSEVVSGTAETVASKIHDIRNSSFFKSFESKLGSAVNTVRFDSIRNNHKNHF